MREITEHLATKSMPLIETDDRGTYKIMTELDQELFIHVKEDSVPYTALLAIVADRLRFFQAIKGNRPRSKGSACALTHIEEAIMWLQRDEYEMEGK
jgi:hypothetical protein